jgi:hypothetical protein
MTRRIREASVGNLPILNTEFSRFMESRTIYSGFGELGYSITPQRTLGTPSEAIFDVVISTGDEIDIVRFGAGEDDVLLTK